MKPRLIAVLALIVLAPLAVVAWLGANAVRDEQAMRELGFRELMLGQLRAVDAVLVRSTDAYRERLLTEMEMPSQNADELRRRVRESAYALQFYVLGADGRLVFPAVNSPGQLTGDERQSLARTQRIWDEGELSVRATLTGDAVSSRSLSSPAVADEARWHTWYRDRGLQLMLWRRSGNVIQAVEVNRTRFLADLIAALPETDGLAPELAEGQVRLVDSAGRTLYQWGAAEPVEGTTPTVEMAVSEPLAAWRLEYYASGSLAGAALGGADRWSSAAALGLLAVAVLGLALYLYREQAREMREAEQRVSFVNQVSHELKTPLTNIRMYAELLDEDVRAREGEDQQSSRYLDVIVFESQRLSRLIGNVLSFGRSQRDALDLHPKPGVVDEVIARVLEQFGPALEAKNVDVEIQAGAGEEVAFDPDALEQILGNLVGNVEKYAASGGLLRIGSRQKGGQVEVTVQDNGPGLSGSEARMVFEPFYRVHNRLTEGVSGTGIGLAIARELARLHGGDLELAPSERGACFRLRMECPPGGAKEAEDARTRS